MTEAELYKHIFASPMFERWHWFRYQFEKKLRGESEPFAESIVEACLASEAVMPGYATRTVDALAAIGGRDRDRRDYEQLLQVLAELLVVRQLATHPWPFQVEFACEPTPLAGIKNPELTIETPSNLIGVEVKAPAMLEYQRMRASRDVQAPSRGMPLEALEELAGSRDQLTLPRDNPLKDFLISAEAKFRPFRDDHENFIGALVIVWDDHVYEPITALEHPASGLFTPHSFAVDEQGDRLTFPSVDGVVLIRHLHQFVAAAGERPTVDSIRHALDYGRANEFPPKPYVRNPIGAGLPGELLDALQAIDYREFPGAEHSPSDLVFWLRQE